MSPRSRYKRLGSEVVDLVGLDVRTAGEFDAGRLPEAQLLDFYRDDFADRLAELDRDARYLLYCRSGNRSAETRSLMEDLGFADVRNIEGASSPGSTRATRSSSPDRITPSTPQVTSGGSSSERYS